MINLVLITESYPFLCAQEQTFLEPELEEWSKVCDRIYFLPRYLEGGTSNKIFGQTDKTLSKSLEHLWRSPKEKYGLLLKHFDWIEQLASLRVWKLKEISKVLSWYRSANVLCRFLESWLTDKVINREPTVFYSYWLNDAAYALALLKRKYPKVTVISRAHGSDIYEKTQDPPLFPFRSKTVSNLDGIATASLHGANYLRANYPGNDHTIWTSYLGVNNKTFEDGSLIKKDSQMLQVVSCSAICENKQVLRIANIMIELAKALPENTIVWTHFGNGPQMKKLQKLVDGIPSNLTVDLKGYQENSTVLDFYRHQYVDFFINMSLSEGLPVSIMEAMSFGIPAVASDVGGTSEIVDANTGLLVLHDESDEKIVNNIVKEIADAQHWCSKRKNSRLKWCNIFNASVNHARFVERIVEITKQS
ncbi:MAG: glycosyltransferase [Bdellovibrionales bacterium]|nr:glycosyltransferase [Bdellovibrionales bacterium]